MFEFLIPAAASLLGGSMASSGAQSAANTQAAAARDAAALQKQMYDEQVARNQPYSQAGLIAQKRYMDLLGLQSPAQAGVGGAPSLRTTEQLRNALMGQYTSSSRQERRGAGGPEGDDTMQTVPGSIDEAGLATAIAAARQGDQNALNAYSTQQAATAPNADFGRYARDFGMADFQQDPGYAFRLSEGLKALDRQAAARGGLMSGAALKGAARYGQDMASQEYGNAFNRYQTNRANQLNPLGSLMQSGQSAVNNQATAAGTYGTNAGNLIMQGGQSIAAGQLGAGNTFNNALGAAASSYQNQNNFNEYMNRQRQLAYIPPVQDGGYSMGQGAAYGGQRKGF